MAKKKQQRKDPADEQIALSVDLTPEMQTAIQQIIDRGPLYLVAFLEALSSRLNMESSLAEQFVAGLEGVMPVLSGAPGDEAFGEFTGPPIPGIYFTVTVKLNGTKPPVTRKLEVPDMVFGELHEVLQVAMGWSNAHLHDFTVGREVRIGPRLEGGDNGFGMEMIDEEDVWISEVPSAARNKIVYLYDFGDGWTHSVKISDAAPMKPGVSYPRCLSGSRNCPPEDCGGVWGYEHICELLTTPEAEQTEDDRERLEWLGEYDPAEFPLELVNAELTKHFATPPLKKKPASKKRAKKSPK